MYKLPVLKKVPEFSIIPEIKNTKLCGVFIKNYAVIKINVEGEELIDLPVFKFLAGANNKIVTVASLEMCEAIKHFTMPEKELYSLLILKKIESWAKENANAKVLIIKAIGNIFLEALNELNFKEFTICDDKKGVNITAKKRYIN